MKCLGCNKTGGYYADETSYVIEQNENEEINCYTNKIKHKGYYLDGDVFKFCLINVIILLLQEMNMNIIQLNGKKIFYLLLIKMKMNYLIVSKR